MAKTERKRTNVARRSAKALSTTRTDSAEPAESAKPKRAAAASRNRKLPAEITRAVNAALDKKAQDVVILDLRNTPAFTDFFVLCSGLNQRQVKAIADAVEEALRAAKLRPAHVEGYDRAEWVLMDYFSFIVHVFTPQTRAFYALERLWGDAERIDVTEEQAKRA
jgi:ribosome-associated protein